MKREKRILILLLALCMLLSMSGCGARQQSPEDVLEESTPGRDVEKAVGLDKVFSLNSNPRYSFNPMIATNRANQLICDLVYENMVEVDNNFEVIPNVISGWKCNEEGTLWTFTLDTETPHTFSTGEAVTPADLCYSLGMCINADRFRGRFSSYQGASPSGEDEFQVTLGIGDTQFVKLLNVPIIKRGTWDTQDGVRPIGSGPYCYNEENTELHANEYYAGRDQLPVDVIYIKEYTDAASTIAAYEDAYIDVVVNDPSSYTSLGYASSNEFHTYAILWTAKNITTYVDGKVQLSYDNRGLGRDDWPYDDPFYVILNLAWGGDWGGAQGVDESALPATMEVDYVRVFQKK